MVLIRCCGYDLGDTCPTYIAVAMIWETHVANILLWLLLGGHMLLIHSCGYYLVDTCSHHTAGNTNILKLMFLQILETLVAVLSCHRAEDLQDIHFYAIKHMIWKTCCAHTLLWP